MTDKQVTVRIHMPESLHERLKAISHAHGMSVTEMMRQATAAYIRALDELEGQ